MSYEPDSLLKLIDKAFDGVILGNGVSLHESVAIDIYESAVGREFAREPDEKHDWRRLVVDPELPRTCGVGGPIFMDAAGFTFHLPAYLTLAVLEADCPKNIDIFVNLLNRLTDRSEFGVEKFSLLSHQQKSCVAVVLQFLRSKWKWIDQDVAGSIREYWDPSANLEIA
ncbi:MAG: DUF6714 family protein [Pirellula sp.]